MSLYASWVHGTAIRVENPENVVSALYRGWGAEFVMREGTQSWFHFALPTPVIVADKRLLLTKVFLLLDSGRGAVNAVHVWDGANLVHRFDNNVNLTGTRGEIGENNTFKLPLSHSVAFGIGISFRYNAFKGSPGSKPFPMVVSTAGGDFSTPLTEQEAKLVGAKVGP